jgi:DNA topoisomerase-1
MRSFWDGFSRAIEQTKDLKVSDVIAALDEDLGPHFFPAREDGSDPRSCPACANGRIGLKLGRYGSFIGCSNYPACQYTRRLAVEIGEADAEVLKDGMRELGADPTTGEAITVRRGPYGLYVQRGENGEDKKVKPRRTSLPRGLDGEKVTLEQAIALLSLPRLIGMHPETKEKIEAGIGRFGPYVRMGSVFGSLDRDDDVLALGLNRAVDLLAKKLASVRTIGPHPKDQLPVTVRKGRFGPYAQHGQMVANLPRGVVMEEITLDEAVALIAEKGKQLKPRGGARRGRGAAGRKAGAGAAAAPAGGERRAAPGKRAAAAPAKRAAAAPTAKKAAAAGKKAAKKKAPARAKKAAANAPAKRAAR